MPGPTLKYTIWHHAVLQQSAVVRGGAITKTGLTKWSCIGSDSGVNSSVTSAKRDCSATRVFTTSRRRQVQPGATILRRPNGNVTRLRGARHTGRDREVSR